MVAGMSGPPSARMSSSTLLIVPPSGSSLRGSPSSGPGPLAGGALLGRGARTLAARARLEALLQPAHEVHHLRLLGLARVGDRQLLPLRLGLDDLVQLVLVLVLVLRRVE